MKTKHGFTQLDRVQSKTTRQTSRVMNNPSVEELTANIKGSEYTATIHRNFRDVNTTSEKVLLVDIRNHNGELFRDHCWVSRDELQQVVPRKNHQKLRIAFIAVEKSYKTHGPVKTTLASIEEPIILNKIK